MTLILAVLLIFTPLAGVAQAADNSPDWIQPRSVAPENGADWVRPEAEEDQPPPIGEQALTALRAQAFSVDLDAKDRVLAALEQRNDNGQLGSLDEQAIEVIAFLATESYDYEVRRSGRTINDFPSVRARAVQLLGSVGGPLAQSTLHHVLIKEQDPFVLAQAVTAIAGAADAPSADLMKDMASLVTRMSAQRRPDNALAAAVVRAVQRFNERFGHIDDPDIFRALISIAQGGYSTTIRRRALEVIDQLRRRP